MGHHDRHPPVGGGRIRIWELYRHLPDDFTTLYIGAHDHPGPQFRDLHLLFEEHYNELALAVDDIAERIRTLGVAAPGTYRPLANKDNDYLMDREGQKAGVTFSGVSGIAMQDASLQESMGLSSIAPRRTWSPPTTASSWPGTGCARR